LNYPINFFIFFSFSFLFSLRWSSSPLFVSPPPCTTISPGRPPHPARNLCLSRLLSSEVPRSETLPAEGTTEKGRWGTNLGFVDLVGATHRRRALPAATITIMSHSSSSLNKLQTFCFAIWLCLFSLFWNNATKIQICTVQIEIEACVLVCNVHFELLNLIVFFLNEDFPSRS